jgi:uncharacterized protein (TIGR02466 family)
MDNNEVSESFYFPSPVYAGKNTDLLPLGKKLCEEYISEAKQTSELNEIYPVYLTQNFIHDDRIKPFKEYILNAALLAFNKQGYDLRSAEVFFTEFWCQEHYKYSGQDYHIHGNGSQMTGFYFVECPKDSPAVIFHDPRPVKPYMSLPELDMSQATAASNMINYNPEPGMVLFTNSWVPHSFSKNPSDKKFRFIHFNIGVRYVQQCQVEQPEII